jgi:Rv2525c-like, glycoside hydrolase-like domain
MLMAVPSGALARAFRSPLGVALLALALALAWQGSAGAASSSARPGGGIAHFRGETVRVPAGWPVIRLDAHPRTCVRLDRRAVYLGRPGASQRCPAGAIGRRRAIVVDPRARARAARERARASRVPLAHLSAASVFAGLGFDACATPSRREMSAWGGSPYRAIGVYVGGTNRGCSQPNLTASWVAEQVAAGWHLIPTYVGLQAPTSSCGSCAKLSASAATSQGTAAAEDAAEQARAVAIGPGSPIYFDMESYSPGGSATTATLNFLAAWTSRLHALGYQSGVYSSGGSGVSDLVARIGSGYLEPDDIWVANWNGRSGSSDPYLPASAWPGHRIRQYRGGHDESYGGVTINIDNDYVEGDTAGTATPGGEDPRGRLDSAVSSLPGQVTISGWAFDPDAPTQPLAIRARLAGKPGRGSFANYELGPIAAQPREDVALVHRVAGPAHGFAATFPVAASGRQRICAYALNVGAGSDRSLGCRTVGIQVPIVVSQIKLRQKAIWVNVSCQWPAGTSCPGHILLQARVRVRHVVRHGRRRMVRFRTIRARLAGRAFALTGGASHAFSVHLSRRGRLLTRGATELRTQLLVAIPGGRRGRGLTLTPGRGLPR